MNNFLQYVQSHNKIKDLNDIIIDEYNLFEIPEMQEQSIGYNNYFVGDLVWVKRYKYKNGKSGFYHIFLIIDTHTLWNNETVYYGMILSSKTEKISYSTNKLIYKNKENNLRKNSIIKTDAIYKIFTKNILLKIGNIDKNKVEVYKNHLINNI